MFIQYSSMIVLVDDREKQKICFHKQPANKPQYYFFQYFHLLYSAIYYQITDDILKLLFSQCDGKILFCSCPGPNA